MTCHFQGLPTLLALETSRRNYLWGEARLRSVWLGVGLPFMQILECLGIPASAASQEKFLGEVILSALLLTQAAFPRLTRVWWTRGKVSVVITKLPKWSWALSPLCPWWLVHLSSNHNPHESRGPPVWLSSVRAPALRCPREDGGGTSGPLSAMHSLSSSQWPAHPQGLTQLPLLCEDFSAHTSPPGLFLLRKRGMLWCPQHLLR